MGEKRWGDSWTWEMELDGIMGYYYRQLNNDELVEWVLEDRLGREWDVVDGPSAGGEGVYRWERDEGRGKSCRERTAAQEHTRDDE